MAVLALSSQVVTGHVGNSATAFALRRLGHDVHAVPTIVLSHHPGHGVPVVLRTPAETVDAMIASVLGRGRPEMVFSGYLADAANAATLARYLRALRDGGRCPLVLDPVMGDSHKGLYVPADVALAIRRDLLPLAGLVLPNLFELGHLADMPVGTEAQAITAAETLMTIGAGAVICTSAPGDAGMATTLVVQPDAAHRIVMTAIPDAPHGTGDLFSGLVMAKRLEGAPLVDAAAHAAAAVHAVIGWSRALRSPDLSLIAGQAALSEPPIPADVERVY